MFLVLFTMALLFDSGSKFVQCDQGFLSTKGCSLNQTSQHIFSGASKVMISFDDYSADDDFIEDGLFYLVRNYFIPQWAYSYADLFAVNQAVDGYEHYTSTNYGFPNQYNRPVIIWSSLTTSESLISTDSLGLDFSFRSLPNRSDSGAAAEHGTQEPNAEMFSYQGFIQNEVHANSFPNCPFYAPGSVVGSEDYTTTEVELSQNFSDKFADASFYCATCPALAPGVTSVENTVYFDGSLWVSLTDVDGYCSYSYGSNLNNPNCGNYRFGFMNYRDNGMDNETEYMGPDCPSGLKVMQLDPLYESNSASLQAMTYLNLLSNFMNSRDLQTYDIQGGGSSYGQFVFFAQEISTGQGTILTIIAMLLLNGFWPVAVWRLAHERSQDIVLMMRTVGMRSSSYILGMFMFDMIISMIAGGLMIVFAVETKLSRFDGAPTGLLIAVVLLSAFALNSWGLVSVTLLGKKSSILTMIAPCLLVACTAATSLLNIMLYRNEGEWPWELSIVPFFAQGRALYLILAFHKGSEEVDVALSWLFLFGFVCLVTTYVVEAEVPVAELLVACWTKYVKGETEGVDAGHIGGCVAASEPNEEAEIELAHQIRQSNNTNNNMQKVSAEEQPAATQVLGGRDNDVLSEEVAALEYSPLSMDAKDRKLAIVIQKLRHVFSSNGHVAVKDLSLALSFGECFGLLGPNGAGTVCLSSACRLPRLYMYSLSVFVLCREINHHDHSFRCPPRHCW